MISIKRKRNHKRVLLIGVCASTSALLFLLYSIFHVYIEPVAVPIAHNPGEKITSSAPAPTTSYGLPVHLEIPRIKVNAKVLLMGLTTTGDMESPTRIEDVGWYKHGAYPGNEGSAVIAGHVGVDQPGVFSNLSTLQRGDRVLVTDHKGKVASFTVRETRTYDQDHQPSEVFHSSNGAHLNLITCSGSWDKNRRSYSKRLIVFTDKSD